MKEYTFQTAGPDIIARVSPTMEALGDQPWRVQLVNPSNQDPLGKAVIIEAASGLEAATEAVDQHLARIYCRERSLVISL